jgi:predicted kinase
MEKSVAIVFVGLPASGKSTFISKLLNNDNFFVYSTDAYIEEVAKQNGSTYNATFDAEIKYATKFMDEKLVEAISTRDPIIWDQTNMSDKKRKKIIHKLEKFYNIHCVCFMPPQNKKEEDELMYRLSHREGKFIPAYVIDNMLGSFVIPHVDEGFKSVRFFDIYGNAIHSKDNDWHSEIIKTSGFSRVGHNNI